MLLFNNKRRSISMCIIGFTGIILITFLYIHSPSNDYPINPIQINIYHHENLINTPTPRILCLILTSPKNFLSRTRAINETWGPRCTGYYFVTEHDPKTLTSEEIKFLEKVPLAPIKNITAGYDHLTQKSTLAFLFAYEYHLNDFEWFIKADDDTYVFVDHLKTFLSEQNSSEPVTFGYNFKVIVPKGYHSGGASYVLSRESLRRFYQAHQDPASNCRADGGSEDVEIAKCLRTKDVYPGKSLDKQERELFHPLPFADHFRGSFPDWLVQYAENPLRTHYNCCGDQTISFHYVSPEEQYLIDFLLYKARPISNIKQNNRKIILP